MEMIRACLCLYTSEKKSYLPRIKCSGSLGTRAYNLWEPEHITYYIGLFAAITSV